MKTIAETIVAVAKEHGAETAETGTGWTIERALDLLADTLAGSDQAQRGTIAEAFDALSDLIAPVPSGTKTITENGTGIDVSGYAYVDVAVTAAEETPAS